MAGASSIFKHSAGAESYNGQVFGAMLKPLQLGKSD